MRRSSDEQASEARRKDLAAITALGKLLLIVGVLAGLVALIWIAAWLGSGHDQSMTTHVVGFASSVVAFGLWAPQARRTWVLRGDYTALRGLSLWTQYGVIGNALLWFAYGYLESAVWIAAPGFINLPLASLNVYFVLVARQRHHAEQDGGCPLCRDQVTHHVFVTEPPGYGSLMPCDGTSGRDWRGPIVLGDGDPSHHQALAESPHAETASANR